MTAKYMSQIAAPASTPPQRQPNPRQRILVVEDEPLTRRLNTEVLACSGYEVDDAEDGAAAWDALQLHNYDLLITDNDMPRVTGVELIKMLQDARMPLPVIMATGSSPEDELSRYIWLQPTAILLKPYTFDELLTAVKKVLRTTADERGEIAPPPNWHSQVSQAGLRP